MRAWLRTSWLFIACICITPYSSAQSKPSSYAVSLRELSIPPKAAHAFQQGMERLAKKDAAGSLPHFQRAILEFASYYEAYDRMGAADLKLWRIPDAEEAFRKSIDLSGSHYAHPLLALGSILDSQEKFAEAESVTLKGLELDPESWTGHYYLALALFGLNRLEEAEKSVQESLRGKPDFAEAHLLLARIHSRDQDYSAAVSDLDEYLELAPDGPASAKALREFTQRMLSGIRGNAALGQSQP